LPEPSTPEWDLFIAHASEDKDDFVRPLAGRLEELGASVWYDDFQLKPGDSLLGAIDRGLANSAFGLLILSKAFLEKPWPNYERRGLTTRELAGDAVVIPVWRDVTHEEVAAFSPPLADKYALTAGEVDRLALEVVKVARPDIFQALARRAAFEKRLQNLPIKKVSLDQVIHEVPPRHVTLPKPLMYRLLLIHEAAYDRHPMSFPETVLNFQRELDPGNEAGIWELLLATYLHIVREDDIPPEGHQEVFHLALRASMEPLDEDSSPNLRHTTIARFMEVKKAMEDRVATFD
jgi:TIR domain